MHRFLSSDRPFEQQPTWKTETRLSLSLSLSPSYSILSLPHYVFPSYSISFHLSDSSSLFLSSRFRPFKIGFSRIAVSCVSTFYLVLLFLLRSSSPRTPWTSSCDNRFIRLCTWKKGRYTCILGHGKRRAECAYALVLESRPGQRISKPGDRWNICSRRMLHGEERDRALGKKEEECECSRNLMLFQEMDDNGVFLNDESE